MPEYVIKEQGGRSEGGKTGQRPNKETHQNGRASPSLGALWTNYGPVSETGYPGAA